MKSSYDALEQIFEEAGNHYKRVDAEIRKAELENLEVTSVIAGTDTKRGDIISISRLEDADESPEEFQARVLSVGGVHTIDCEDEQVDCVEALCVVLQPGDLETAESFADVYGGGPIKEPTVATETPLCSCGANKELCEKQQQIFGNHVN